MALRLFLIFFILKHELNELKQLPFSVCKIRKTYIFNTTLFQFLFQMRFTPAFSFLHE